VQQLDGTAVEARIVTVDWEAETGSEDGFPHFLLKEIHEQPEAVRNALRGRIDDLGMVVLPELGMSDDQLASVHEVVLVACGSAVVCGDGRRIRDRASRQDSLQGRGRERVSATARRSSTSIHW